MEDLQKEYNSYVYKAEKRIHQRFPQGRVEGVTPKNKICLIGQKKLTVFSCRKKWQMNHDEVALCFK